MSGPRRRGAPSIEGVVVELGRLPEVDAERVRVSLAARLGWPEGALEACRAVEAQAPPGFHVWWVPGGLSRQPEPGFTARQGDDACGKQTRLFARTPDALVRAIEEAGPNPPHDSR